MQIFLVSLLLIFVFNNFGYWFCFKIEQADIRREMFERTKQNLPNTQLISIVVSSADAKDLAWEGVNEFNYKGTMYDVVRKETKADQSTVYYCLNDAKEELLFTNLDSHLRDNLYGDKTSGKRSTVILKFFSHHYFNITNTLSFFSEENNSFSTGSEIIYSPVKPDVLCPPPDHLS